jgi:RimJ/RimL family protein N-acetyltransferase
MAARKLFQPSEPINDDKSIMTDRLVMRTLDKYEKETLSKNYSELLTASYNVTYFRDGKPWEKSQVETFINTHLARMQAGSTVNVYAVHIKESNQFIGSCNLYYRSNEFKEMGGLQNVVEIGYIIDKTYWNKGYGKEFVKAAFNHVQRLVSDAKEKNFSFMENGQPVPVPTAIVATVHPENQPSIKILEKSLDLEKTTEGKPKVFVKASFSNMPRLLFFKSLSELKLLEKQPEDKHPKQLSPVLVKGS